MPNQLVLDSNDPKVKELLQSLADGGYVELQVSAGSPDESNGSVTFPVEDIAESDGSQLGGGGEESMEMEDEEEMPMEMPMKKPMMGGKGKMAPGKGKPALMMIIGGK